MTKLTIEVPDDFDAPIDAATGRWVASEHIVALSFLSRRSLSLVAIGRSGSSDTAEGHEEINQVVCHRVR